MIPDGVTAHFARVWITEDSPEELHRMIEYVPKACEELSHARMDIYGFGCTSGSLIKGLDYDRQILGIIRDKTGKPATTTSTACIEAFQELGIKRISLVTPYEDWLNEKQKSFLEGNGLEVLAMKGIGTRNAEEIAGQDPGRVYRLAMEVAHPQAEATFISCTDLQATVVLDAIERDTGRPAVASNQAMLWAMLRLAGVREPIPGYGRLLAML
jgi:maleate isomerase